MLMCKLPKLKPRFLFVKSPILALSIFIFVSIFGLSLSMDKGENGTMSSCKFMYEESQVCQMSLADHLSSWQNMFAAISDSQAFYLFLTVIFLGFSFLTFSILTKSQGNVLFLDSRQHYKQGNFEIKLFDWLLIAFSKGTIHPKIFA